jgi:hypothetical protein
MMPACFGVVCPQRARCMRYAAVSTSDADPATLLTCVDQGRFPLFVARRHPPAPPRRPPAHPVHLHLVDE